MTTTTRVALYARVSDDQCGQSQSVPQQVAALRAECARRGWTVVRELTDDGVSASRYARAERPGWQELRRMVRDRECDVVAVWELSRLSRDLSTFALFRDECEAAGVRWLTPTGLHDPSDDTDRLGLGVQGLLAEQHSRDTSKRVKRAMQASAAQGRPHGRNAYGYVRVYGPARELVRVEVQPDEAAVLLRAADAVLSGRSLRSVCRELEAEGTPTPSEAVAARVGRSVTPTGGWEGRDLKRLLCDPRYAGLRTFKGEVTGPGQWPALWTEEQHRRLVAILRDPARGEPRSTELRHYLSGLLECEHCHHGLRVVNRRNGGPAYYCHTAGCHKVAIKQAEVEETIRGLVLRAARDRRLQRSDADQRIADLLAEVGALRARLAEAEAEFTAGRLSAALLGRVEADLTARVAALSAEIDRVGVQVPLPSLEALESRWEALPPDQRRHLCQLALGRIVVRSAGRARVPAMARLRFPDLQTPPR